MAAKNVPILGLARRGALGNAVFLVLVFAARKSLERALTVDLLDRDADAKGMRSHLTCAIAIAEKSEREAAEIPAACVAEVVGYPAGVEWEVESDDQRRGPCTRSGKSA